MSHGVKVNSGGGLAVPLTGRPLIRSASSPFPTHNLTRSYVEYPRVFYPSTLLMRCRPTLQALTIYNPMSHTTNTLFKTLNGPADIAHIDAQTIVVSCAVINSALAVNFGPDSRYNFTHILPATTPKLSAEIFAVQKCLKLGRGIANVFGPDRVAVMRIVVATSSKEIVKAMTRWLEEWTKNEAMPVQRTFEEFEDPADRKAMERIDRFVEEIVEEDGTEVEFWLLDNESLHETEALVREKLREAK
ncbi:uncharacterized protein H6S33_004078 [Morchella sextelata]|uniref:uncharacterized protein n=1 Tax=Morchella sextelata TaxID=1174677 RepID=UPI001D04677D|nr:uncharacterized protein H6S33_004078 [Morchella sextelata]KAH0606417.1 hypothetical protein H6S33_004078 [Morchella sextelata]